MASKRTIPTALGFMQKRRLSSSGMAAPDAAADGCLADDLALRELAVGFWAHDVEERPCVGLAELHECLLCFDMYHFFSDLLLRQSCPTVSRLGSDLG